MRSHGSRRLCQRGAGTAAGSPPGPVPGTVSGSPGLLTQLPAGPVVPAPPVSGAAYLLPQTIHGPPGEQRDGGGREVRLDAHLADFFPYCPEKMRAMVPAIYANTVNPIQNNAMMENGIMAFTVTSLPAL